MINLQQVSKSFGNIKAIDNLSLEIKDGEIVGLLGPNGAGKTTTMRVMTGYLTADTGRVMVNGIDVFTNPMAALKQIGYMPENNPLYKEMLVAEILNYTAALRNLTGPALKEALNFVVDAVNISQVYNRPVGELSKGFRQRVGIAAALLHKPTILILDEPSEGLDPNQRGEIRTLIKRLAHNHTIVISTHVMAEVEAVCSRLLIINRGKLVADGSPTKLTKLAGGGNKLIVDLEGVGVATTLKKLFEKRIKIIKSDNKRVKAQILNENPEPVQLKLSREIARNKWVVWELAHEKQLLENVFRELTQ